MTASAARTAKAGEANRRATERTKAKVRAAAEQMIKSGEPITKARLIAISKTSRNIWARHPDLHAEVLTAIEEQQQRPLPVESNRKSRNTLEAELASQKGVSKRLRQQLQTAHTVIADRLGEQAALDIGLGRDDVAILRERLAMLEQANHDLRRENRDLQDDLEAARSVNRQHMHSINRPTG